MSSSSQSNKGQLVRYQHGKNKFEVLTKSGSVLKYRNGKLGWDKVLMAEMVFTNSSRGDVASGKDLEDAFGTTNIEDCCKLIVEKGELQLSAQERKEEMDNKKNEIIQYIFKNFMDPKTKLPHPPDRIENCMKDCHVKIDPKKETKKQAEDAIKSMNGKLAFTKQVAIIIRLFIKHAYIGQCNNFIHSSGHVIEQDWKSRSDGCIFIIELSRAEMDRLVDCLRKPTNGGDFDLQVQGDANSTDNFSSAETQPSQTGKKSHKTQTKNKIKSQPIKDYDMNEEDGENNNNQDYNDEDDHNKQSKSKSKGKSKSYKNTSSSSQETMQSAASASSNTNTQSQSKKNKKSKQ